MTRIQIPYFLLLTVTLVTFTKGSPALRKTSRIQIEDDRPFFEAMGEQSPFEDQPAMQQVIAEEEPRRKDKSLFKGFSKLTSKLRRPKGCKAEGSSSDAYPNFEHEQDSYRQDDTQGVQQTERESYEPAVGYYEPAEEHTDFDEMFGNVINNLNAVQMGKLSSNQLKEQRDASRARVDIEALNDLARKIQVGYMDKKERWRLAWQEASKALALDANGQIDMGKTIQVWLTHGVNFGYPDNRIEQFISREERLEMCDNLADFLQRRFGMRPLDLDNPIPGDETPIKRALHLQKVYGNLATSLALFSRHPHSCPTRCRASARSRG